MYIVENTYSRNYNTWNKYEVSNNYYTYQKINKNL